MTLDCKGYGIHARQQVAGVLSQTQVLHWSKQEGLTLQVAWENRWYSTSVRLIAPSSWECTFTPEPVEIRRNGWVMKGEVGLTALVTLNVSPPAPESVPTRQWVPDLQTVGLVGVLAALGLVAATLGEDALTAGVGVADDAVSFAAALGMLGLSADSFEW